MARDLEQLTRFLRPQTVAIVGASERQARSNNAVGAMREAGVELFFVNPTRPEVYGAPSHASVSAIGRPVDAVLSLVNAPLAVETVADARAAGAGGVVVIAGGFAEAGGDGVELQQRLADARGDMPVLGPNCNGFVRPETGARLSGAPRLPFPQGSVGVVTHSGALLGALGLAAHERGIGYSSLISTGNEMDLDIADCLDFLVDDDQTAVIGLVIETLRSPGRFFAAARRAQAAGKPIVALKLGRSPRGAEIATSHTGALAGEPWVYEAVFRQHGIISAGDLVDLLDRLALLAQLPRSRWTPVDGLAVVSLSGGMTAMASDVCAEEGVVLPALTELREEVNAVIPDRTTVNPLDMTGFAMGRQDVVEQLLLIFAASPSVDALAVQWFVDAAAEGPGGAIIDAAVNVAARIDKPVILSSVEDGHLGPWARALPGRGVAVGRGLRATVRGLATMREHLRAPRPTPHPSVRAVARPRDHVIASAAGPMLSFGAAMELLRTASIPVAPYAILDADAEPAPPEFDGPYVVKLADVPHRTDIGAVRLGVTADQLDETVGDLRALAHRRSLPATVVIQPMIALHGEALLGIQADSQLGALAVCGVGGIFVELLHTVGGALAPVSLADAHRALDALAPAGVFDGQRGGQAWDRDALADLFVAIGRLAEATSGWLASLDVNPLAVTADGFVALDGLCLLRPETQDAG
jgi:acyl-CoA synthetase (NDP forming)